MEHGTDDRLFVGIDGDEVEPKTVDARILLHMAALYLDVMRAEARQAGIDVAFRGVEIVNKCAAVSPGIASEYAAELIAITSDVVVGTREPAYGAKGPLHALSNTIASLPAGQTALVQFRGKRTEITKHRDQVVQSHLVASFRAIIQSVGGVIPSVLVKRISGARLPNEGAIRLYTSGDLAQLAGTHLYKQADIRAQLSRNAETKEVLGGTLLSLRLVHDVDPDETIRLWKEWAAQQGFDRDELDALASPS